ncbi:hypothetical protein LTR56_004513 [Elasticomyces elasticus]|nr:hypothetical protein LTR56_004513 [Elasticomyces elasticus]KAK3654247.1 hypothetical protein LTR22_010873 [Elasticomyces elasticus]KAK4919980.1 hypothetical protein LTR49_012418 [Elasticomyces elasticus]KAK5758814.1 hypothetical protein LTS12_011055 [Elasticomyces elasticus]
MRSTRVAQQALGLAALPRSQQYVCRACRAQAGRQFHTSNRDLAEVPFFQRLKKQIFGSKKSQQAEKSREEKNKQRLELHNNSGPGELEVKTGRHGQQYEVAAIVDPSDTKDYVPAQGWDGLERVGSEEWVKARADQGEQYVGFVPKKRVELSNKQWQMLLHHIMVEILALQQAGRAPGQVCYPRNADMYTWRQTRKAAMKSATNRAGATVSFSDLAAEQFVLQAIPESAPTETVQDQQVLINEVEFAVADADDALGWKASSDLSAPSWMDISIKNPSVKMAVCVAVLMYVENANVSQLIKRTLQLTGKRLPDPAVSLSTTLAELYNHLHLKDQPKKLAQTPQMQRIKLTAPNVKVFTNRQTPIHKEKEIGRWKIIEEELVRRDLPVTGSRWQGAKSGWQ